MLIFKDTKFIKSPFTNEAELEQVVIDNYEYLFGPTAIYLPKAKIKTSDGAGTIPDGFVIDIGTRRWYIVEVELMHHSVWSHIAPQVTKQILASTQKETRRVLTELVVELYESDDYTREKFEELQISTVNVRQVVGDILETNPSVGMPIDGIKDDLRDWAKTLKNEVKLWVISKFVEMSHPENIIYEFPEEFRPEFDTEKKPEIKEREETGAIAYFGIEIAQLIESGLLVVGQKLYMNYKPRNGRSNKQYEAVILEDGSLEVLGQKFSSPSYAALAGIQDAGSDRKTVNGWTSWKNEKGETIADLRDVWLRDYAEKEQSGI